MTRGGPRSSAPASAVLYAAKPNPLRNLSGSSAATMSGAMAMAITSMKRETVLRIGMGCRPRQQLGHVDIMRVERIGRIASGFVPRRLAELARRDADDAGEGA